MNAIVKRRNLYNDGKAVRNMKNKPLLNTRAYKVDFADGKTKYLTANIISNNLLAQVDDDGHRIMLLDNIIYHIQDVIAIGKEDAFTEMTNGTKRRKTTTAYWQLCIIWRYGSTNWVALKVINQ